MADRSAAVMTQNILADTKLKNDLKADTERVLNEQATLAVSQTPGPADKFVYRVVVSSLGIVLLIVIGGLIVLNSRGKDAPESVIALASAALGALAGLLAPAAAPQ